MFIYFSVIRYTRFFTFGHTSSTTLQPIFFLLQLFKEHISLPKGYPYFSFSFNPIVKDS